MSEEQLICRLRIIKRHIDQAREETGKLPVQFYGPVGLRLKRLQTTLSAIISERMVRAEG